MSSSDPPPGKRPRQNRFLSTSEPFNPYTPPQAPCEPLPEPEGLHCYRRGKLLIVQNGSPLPSRCVKCNALVSHPAKMRGLLSHPPIIYLLFPLYPLIYLIAAAFLPKAAKINPALCYAHAFQRAVNIATSGVAFGAGVILSVVKTAAPDSTSFESIALFLISSIICLSGVRILVPARIDSEWLRLKGCGRAFLDSLPPAPESLR